MTLEVGIVNYNAGEYLGQCLGPIVRLPGISHIYVVDNASRDDSLLQARHKIQEAQNLEIISNDRNYGYAHAVNQFLNLARSEYLLILNPDCRVEADALRTVCAALEAHPDAGMAGCLLLNPDGSEQRGGRRDIPDPANSLRRIFYGKAQAHRGFDLVNTTLPTQCVEVEAISGAFMLVRRAALAQVGLMDEGYFLHCEDLDWCLRFRQAGWKILFVPYATAVHQQGVSSKSRPLFVLWHKHRGMWRFYRKFYLAQYSALFNVLVWFGIWARFSVLIPTVVVSRIRRGRN